MTLILSALADEIGAVNARISHGAKLRFHTLSFKKGYLEDRKVIAGACGVGKSMTALSLQYLIDRFSPERIIYTGIAGALNPAYEIGDIIVAKDCVQYDFDVTSLGFPLGEVPFSGLRFFPSDEELLTAASSFVPASGKLHTGRICTGDSFLGPIQEARIRSLRDELSGDAVDMEGAAAGMAAIVNRVPFLLVRTISDKAGEKTPKGFKKIIKRGAENFLSIVLHLFAKLP